MTWSNPWLVGGNAETSEQTARTLAFIASGGAEGIAQPADLKVVATPVPSSQLAVSIGGAIILNRGADSYEQSYVGVNADPDTVTINPTNSTGVRRDLVAVRVEDPNAVGGTQWAGNGADPDEGPFLFTRVIENVPAGTTRLQDVPGHGNDVGFALALVTIPANTATITSAMLTDLRQIARPRETRVVARDLGQSVSTLTQTADRVFPAFQPSFVVPDWATHVEIEVTVSQISAASNSNGYAALQLRESDGQTIILPGDTMAYNADASGGGNTRFVHLSSTYGDVRSYRGRTIRPSNVMRKASAAAGDLSYDQYAQIKFVATFYERIV
ncbi:hypothetical protein [Curtobacterium sp. DN_7.5]|uniref:hypothetical protein n=1 Tax=Curtobacterium sp. DN_7.5 TaxID=3049047 RepID=UPI001F585885|nr:hypothetical protein [Curtobacterium sp. DN_7.5]